MSDLRGQVDSTLHLADADKVNVAYALLRILESAADGDRPQLLGHIVDGWDGRSTNKEVRLPRLISANELPELKRRYGKVVDSALDMMTGENPPVDDFYRELDALVRNPIFKDEKARAFSLYWILIDSRLPYFQLEKGLRVSNEDWGHLAEKLASQSAKVKFILAVDFEQRSEEADLLLRELDALEGPERVRLMATLMWEVRETEQQRSKAKAMSELLRQG